MHWSLLGETAPGDSRQVLVQCQDVTAHNRRATRLQFLAERDPLTGLWNRRKLEEELHQHHLQVNRYGAEGAVLMVDIDDFKAVNDTLGHHAGDRLLVALANILTSRLRESDLVARIGGDEFAVVLPKAGREEAVEVAKAINRAVRESHLRTVIDRELSVSIGIAPFHQRDPDAAPGAMLVEADQAMYEAKRSGRDRYAVFAGF